MNAGTIKWLGMAAVLTLVGIAGVLGHVILAKELGVLSYLILTIIATLLGLGIGYAAAEVNRRHQQQIERHNEELSVLNAVAFTASRSLELSSLLHDCLDKTVEVMKLDAGAIYLLTDQEEPSLAAQRGLTPEFLEGLARARIVGEGGGSGVAPDKPFLVAEQASPADAGRMRATVSVPLRSEGCVLGAMYLVSQGFRAFTEREVQILLSLGDVIGMAVQNAKLHAQVKEHAIRDPLTGLYNRRYFDEVYRQEVERAHRYGMPLTVAMIDIDDFKRINDTRGHRAGDAVLEAVGMVLRDVRVSDIAARYGGDEFVVMMPNTLMSGACVVAERIARAARETVSADTPEGGIALSIGLADSTEGYFDLLERADERMYREKRAVVSR